MVFQSPFPPAPFFRKGVNHVQEEFLGKIGDSAADSLGGFAAGWV
jgi:hypothetical protein